MTPLLTQANLEAGSVYLIRIGHRRTLDRFLGYRWQTLLNPDGSIFSLGYCAAVFESLGPLRITGDQAWCPRLLPRSLSGATARRLGAGLLLAGLAALALLYPRKRSA